MLPAHNVQITAKLDRPTDSTQAGYIFTLDGWRAIAVLLVVGAHCTTMLQNNGSLAANAVAGLLRHAGYGVDVFFVISGFLISTLLLREKARTGDVSLARFYTHRIFRIIPAIMGYIGALYLLRRFGFLGEVTNNEIFGSLFFFRNYIDGSWYTGHFWSLSIEEHFYLGIPLMIAICNPRKLLALSFAGIALCVLIRAYELSHSETLSGLVAFRTESRVDALLWGSIAAQFATRPAGLERIKHLLSPRVIVAIVLAASLLLIFLDGQGTRRTVAAISIPPIILYTVSRPAGFLGRFMELRALKIIGRISYSLYIWQMLFLVPYERTLGPLQSFPFALILAFVLACISYRFVETPMIALGHRLAKGLNNRNLRRVGRHQK